MVMEIPVHLGEAGSENLHEYLKFLAWVLIKSNLGHILKKLFQT